MFNHASATGSGPESPIQLLMNDFSKYVIAMSGRETTVTRFNVARLSAATAVRQSGSWQTMYETNKPPPDYHQHKGIPSLMTPSGLAVASRYDRGFRT